MYTIVSDTIAEAHEKVVKLIMAGKDFNDVLTEDNEQTFELPEPCNIHINTPFKEPMISKSLQFGKKSMDKYVEEILYIRPLTGERDFSYLYSNLIFDYPKYDGMDDTGNDVWDGNGNGYGINQMQYAVRKILSDPATRRAVISLFNPQIYEETDDPPCLNHIQFMIRNNELNCHALFRSNDMLSAWGCNAYALAHLQKHMLDNLIYKYRDLELGYLETTSISAHIYFKRDQNQVDEFKRKCF